MEHNRPRLVNEIAASKILGISRISLRRQRSEGAGKSRMPLVPYVHLGRRILYDPRDLELIIRENRVPLREVSE